MSEPFHFHCTYASSFIFLKPRPLFGCCCRPRPGPQEVPGLALLKYLEGSAIMFHVQKNIIQIKP